METVAILDFETTGLSPAQGDRATEIAIVLIRGDQEIDRFESLMNAGRWIPDFVCGLTGITNEMIATAPPAAQVMAEAARFVGRHPVVAHNASFDQRFWNAELARIEQSTDGTFACTMLLARRLYPRLANHRLQSLVAHLRLPGAGRAHRAMADAVVTGHLWNRLRADIAQQTGGPPPGHPALSRLQRVPLSEFQTAVRRA
jgi:DNA polymerase-3 subunit epsilon